MSMNLAAALGGAAGALALIVILFISVRCFLCRRSTSRTSESNSSTSTQAGQSIELSVQGGSTYLFSLQGLRQFHIEELNLATKNFSDINLIGHGIFGDAYKGLLQDGTIVAIKIRPAGPSQIFVGEVQHLSSIRHRNLVTLLGYCQESNTQMLIYEYIPNASVSSHLYGASQVSSKRLEFKHRLSIAHGAARGLEHLHALNPPLVHMNFKTANVLVDEDFIPKVADAGLRILLYRINGAGTSQITLDDPFLDPEVRETGRFSVRSDVYSFGVFLIELISGHEARSEQSIRKWVQNYQLGDLSNLVDQRMSSSYTSEGMREFMQLIVLCLNPFVDRRPPTNYLASELNRIQEKEMSLTTIMGEGTTVILGSQLFK